MPNTSSAKKRLKTSTEARDRNRAVKSSIHTIRRRMTEAIAAGDKAKAESEYRTYCSGLDKAVKKGVVNKNTASRSKSRAFARVAAV